jgi:hypothetical protein
MAIIWKGVKRGGLGDDVVTVEFEGEIIGVCWEEYDGRGVETTFFSSDDEGVVVHCVRWSQRRGEPDYAEIYTFASLEDATRVFRWEMERAGIIPPLQMTLDEVLREE